jgi:hypothetical protein
MHVSSMIEKNRGFELRCFFPIELVNIVILLRNYLFPVTMTLCFEFSITYFFRRQLFATTHNP